MAFLGVGIFSAGVSGQTNPPAGATSDGNAASTLAGGALGAASLGLLSSLGSLVPCRRTAAGTDCVRIFAASGAALGLAAGTIVGQSGSRDLAPVARGAAYGSLAGAIAGLGLRVFLSRSQWLDVVGLTAVGGAIGAAPVGSGVGLAVGGAVGIVLWKTIPGFTLPDAAGASLAGMAAGALFDWFNRAANARAATTKIMEVRIPVGWQQ
jgi:hypothetical protein